MELTFWGVRGEIPVPGPGAVRYGGNTACIDIVDDGNHRAVIDSGTGIIGFGKSVLGGPCGKGGGEIYIFLSHTHWDHIQGFPYFVPAYIPGNKIHFWGRPVTEQKLSALLEGQMRAEYNPIYELKNMGSTIDINEMHTEKIGFGHMTMFTTVVPHRGRESIGYRITDNNHTAVLLGDVNLNGEIPDALAEFCKDADLLIYDASECRDHGCGSVAQIARDAGVGKVLLTHYPADFLDEDIDKLVGDLKGLAGSAFEADGACEGMKIQL